MRTAARRDTPERAIISAAEALGAVVLQVSGVGLPDTLVLHKGRTYLVEVKRPGHALTHAQSITFARIVKASVPVYVVETPEAMAFLLQSGGAGPSWLPDSRPVEGVKTTPHRPGVDKARTVAELCCKAGCPRSRARGSYGCAKHPEATDEVIPPPRQR